MRAHRRRTIGIAAVLAAAALSVSTAFAAGSTWSVGAGYGSIGWDSADVVAIADPGSGVPPSFVLGDADDSDSAWKVWLARALTPTLDLEADYVDLGQVRNAVDFGGGVQSSTAEASAYSLSLVGKYPMMRSVDLFLRFGWYNWKVDVTSTAPTRGASEDGSEFDWGLGLDVLLTRRSRLRLEWERLKNFGPLEGDLYSAGLSYRF